MPKRFADQDGLHFLVVALDCAFAQHRLDPVPTADQLYVSVRGKLGMEKEAVEKTFEGGADGLDVGGCIDLAGYCCANLCQLLNDLGLRVAERCARFGLGKLLA